MLRRTERPVHSGFPVFSGMDVQRDRKLVRCGHPQFAAAQRCLGGGPERVLLVHVLFCTTSRCEFGFVNCRKIVAIAQTLCECEGKDWMMIVPADRDRYARTAIMIDDRTSLLETEGRRHDEARLFLELCGLGAIETEGNA